MRIRPEAGFLLDDVRDAVAGRIVPAPFQRPYVWSRDDVEALWTSIMEGWPIGALLLWEPGSGTDRAAAGRLRLGPVEREPGDWDAMILDGQNRLATIAWSLLDPDATRPDPARLSAAEAETWDPAFALACDLERREIRFVPGQLVKTPAFLPAAALADVSSFWRHVRARPQLSDDDINWVDGVSTRLREARVSKTTLERATPKEAVRAFRHVGRTGQPMGAEDLEAALSWLEAAPGARPATGR